MEDRYDRRQNLASAPNLRDLGGFPAGGAKVRRGVVYRSATLASLTDEDLLAFSALDVRTVCDLRTAAEVLDAPDRLPSRTEYVTLDVLSDSSMSVAASLAQFVDDPRAFASMLAEGRAAKLFAETYRDFIRLPSAARAYRSLFQSIGNTGRDGAALFHCTTGKDRTGWAAAALLSLVGVSESDVFTDYLQTNTDLLPALEPMIQEAQARGVDRELLLPVLGVREEYLSAAFAEMRDRFGSVRDYASKGLGLSESEIAGVHEVLLG